MAKPERATAAAAAAVASGVAAYWVITWVCVNFIANRATSQPAQEPSVQVFGAILGLLFGLFGAMLAYLGLGLLSPGGALGERKEGGEGGAGDGSHRIRCYLRHRSVQISTTLKKLAQSVGDDYKPSVEGLRDCCNALHRELISWQVFAEAATRELVAGLPPCEELRGRCDVQVDAVNELVLRMEGRATTIEESLRSDAAGDTALYERLLQARNMEAADVFVDGRRQMREIAGALDRL